MGVSTGQSYYFFVTKRNNIKAGRPCMELSSTPNTIFRVFLTLTSKGNTSPIPVGEIGILLGDENLRSGDFGYLNIFQS